jgi:hypothetical protein
MTISPHLSGRGTVAAVSFLILVIISGIWFASTKMDSERFEGYIRQNSAGHIMEGHSFPPTPFFPDYDFNLLQ